jgi:hypothetical protein
MTHPSTDYYTLGRGLLSIAEWTGSAPGTYQDVGNCPRFDVTLSEQKLEHFSSRSGLRTKDKVVTLEVGYTINFDLDEISRENLAKFLKGTLSGSATILGLQGADKTFAIKFVSQNPSGKNFTWEFWKVKLSPASALALIGDDWQKLSFSGEGESDVSNHPASPYFNAVLMTTTTTTTTTT